MLKIENVLKNLSTQVELIGYTAFHDLSDHKKTGPGSGAATNDSVARQADDR
jgi:hypothetical protein